MGQQSELRKKQRQFSRQQKRAAKLERRRKSKPAAKPGEIKTSLQSQL